MPLGEVSDGEIARHLGCLTSQVRQARSRRGIGPFMAPSRGPKHIDWDNYPLGQKPDTDIAAEAGVSPKAVRDARRKRNISVYRRMSHKWDEHPLGKVSDYALAQKLGVTRSTVKKARKLRGIPACPIGDNKCNGTDWDAQPLGEQRDTVLADALGLSITSVRMARGTPHIPPPRAHTPRLHRDPEPPGQRSDPPTLVHDRPVRAAVARARNERGIPAHRKRGVWLNQ